jgi:hypothetical protein
VNNFDKIFLNMLQEIYHLLDPKVAENSAAIRKLLGEFSSMLPSQFGRPYFVPSPNPDLLSVLRANCSNPGCSVRAVVHIERNKRGILRIKEEKPIFDRQGNPCSDCKKLFTNPS